MANSPPNEVPTGLHLDCDVDVNFAVRHRVWEKSRNIAIVYPRHELTWTTTRNLLDRRPTSVNSFDIS